MPDKYTPLPPKEPQQETAPKLSTADKARLMAATGLRIAGPYAGGIGGGLLAAALGIGTEGAGLAAAPAMVAGGAGLGGGLSEMLAQKIEPHPGHSVMSPDPTINKKRVGIAAALGAVPGSWAIRSGKPLISAVTGAGLGYAGVAGNKWANGEPIEKAFDPTEMSKSDLLFGPALGAGVGAGISKLHGSLSAKPPTTNPDVYEIQTTAHEGGTVLGGGKVNTGKGGKVTLSGAKPQIVSKIPAIKSSGEPIDIELPRGDAAVESSHVPITGTPAEASGRVQKVIAKEDKFKQDLVKANEQAVIEDGKRNDAAITQANAEHQRNVIDALRSRFTKLVEPTSTTESVSRTGDHGGTERTSFRYTLPDDNTVNEGPSGPPEVPPSEPVPPSEAEPPLTSYDENPPGPLPAAPTPKPPKAAPLPKPGAVAKAIEAGRSWNKLTEAEQNKLLPHIMEAHENGYPGGIEKLGDDLADKLLQVKEGHYSMTEAGADKGALARAIRKGGAIFDDGSEEIGKVKQILGKSANGIFSKKSGRSFDQAVTDITRENPGMFNGIGEGSQSHDNFLNLLAKQHQMPEMDPFAELPKGKWWEPSADVNGELPPEIPADATPPGPSDLSGEAPSTPAPVLPKGPSNGPGPRVMAAVAPDSDLSNLLSDAHGDAADSVIDSLNAAPKGEPASPAKPPVIPPQINSVGQAEPVLPGMEPTVNPDAAPVAEAPYALGSEVAQPKPVPQPDLFNPPESPATPEPPTEPQIPTTPEPPQGGVIPARDLRSEFIDAGKAYGKVKGTKTPEARVAGQRAAQLHKEYAATNPSLEDISTLPPEQQDPLLKELVKRFKTSKLASPTGAIDPMLMSRLGLGAVGAAGGAVMNPDDPLTGATIGGAAGVLAPSAIRAFSNLKGSDLVKRLPDMQRFNYLSDPNGLAANTMAAPIGLGATTGIERMLAGDKRGWQLLKGLPGLPGKYKDLWNEAGTTLASSPMNISEALPYQRATNPFDKAISLPATSITAAHMALRDTGMHAGFTPEESLEMALGNDPGIGSGSQTIRAYGKGLQNMKSTRLDNGEETPNIIGNMLAPFTRTATNVAAATPTRIPGVGLIIKAVRGSPESWRNIVAQQGVGGAVSLASYELGSNTDPETAKYLHKWVRNLGGRYGLIASTAFMAGQAERAGKPLGSSIMRGLEEGFPMPTSEVLKDWGNFGQSLVSGDGIKAPRSAIPAILQPVIKANTDLLTPPDRAYNSNYTPLPRKP